LLSSVIFYKYINLSLYSFMFDLLFQLSVVFLIIMFTKNIMDMKKYNDESSLVELKEFKIDNIRDGINQILRPNPIALLNVVQIDHNFHARFSAKKRTYEYRIINRRSPLTLQKNKAWIVFKKLDIEKMEFESSFFIGKHDLESFRSVDCQSKTTIKTIDKIKFEKNNDYLSIFFTAKSFLHSQVRIMVGTLVDIGKGKITKSIDEIIKNKDRSKAGMTAPACGLYLKKIEY